MPADARTTRPRYPWWWIVIGLLVCTNVVTVIELVRVRSVKVPLFAAELERSQVTLGGARATLDYENGERRQYEAIPAARRDQAADTGRRDGPFEVWTWSYADHVVGGAAAAEAFVRSYNQTMRQLHEQAASGG